MRLPLWRRRQDEELDEELRSHLQMAIRDRVERGESLQQATDAARREFGNVLLVKETTRDMWGWVSIEQLWQDLVYAGRALRRTPGFTTAAVLTLALGIGANAAMFSVVYAVILRPLPFPDADRLMAINGLVVRDAGQVSPSASSSWPDYFDWRAKAQTFASLSAYHDTNFTVTGLGRSQHVPGAIVSAEFFATLGVAPSLGRAFRREEEHAGSNVIVVSDQFWRSQLGMSGDAVGRTMMVNGRSFTIIAVMPAGFRFPITFPPPELWTTIAEDAQVEEPGDTPMTAQRGAHFLQVIGRLKEGVRESAARAELETIASALAQQYPEDNAGRSVRVVPELEAVVGSAKRPLLVLLAAVACVLLIACVNLANLMTARGTARQRELALRMALGASRYRVARLVLTESLVLAVAGAALGLVAGSWLVRLLVHLSPTNIRGLDEVSMDAAVLVFTAAIALACGLFVGVAPAMRVTRSQPRQDLSETRTTAGRSQRRLLNALIVVETALGVLLLAVATFLVRGFDRLTHTDPGFDPSHVVTLRVGLPDSRYTYLKKVAFFDELLPELARLPGIEAVSLVAPLPLGGSRFGVSFDLPGRTARSAAERLSAEFAFVGPDYFRAMRIPLRRGREFTAADGDDAPRVVVINEAFAQQYFPGEEPLGKRIRPGLSTTEDETPWREVVGIAGNVKQQTLNERVKPLYFVPYAQGMITTPHIVLRSAGPPEAVPESARKLIAARDPELAVFDVRTMDEYFGRVVASPRFTTLLLMLFAVLGVALSAVGLYGVLAYTVVQRTHEFGVRFALGARPRDVVRGVMGGAFALVGSGLLVGVVASMALNRALARTLDFVQPVDAAAYPIVALVLLSVAAVAAYTPARRAARVDPVTTLRAG